MRVLIAEDDTVSRLVLTRFVESIGHEVMVASDGAEAWDLYSASEEAVDVVISDWLMPGLNGIDFCQRIRSRGSAHYTYVVLITALDGKDHFLSGMQAGADDYLIKPLDRDTLQARLIAAERVTSLHRELAAKTAELERFNRALADSARTDPLTQLGNRLRLREDLDLLESRAARHNAGFCVALFDVDYFKAYNDRYGHLAGDEALCTVAKTIRDCIRAGDGAYRYGGEEFLVVLPDQTLQTAIGVVERLRRAVETLQEAHESSPEGVLTISIGLAAMSGEEPAKVEEVLRRADSALYRAKEAGRNRVGVDEESLRQASLVLAPAGELPRLRLAM